MGHAMIFSTHQQIFDELENLFKGALEIRVIMETDQTQMRN